MSISHLLLAACDMLRIGMKDDPYNYREEQIDITPKGQPIPSAGERFIGLCGTSWTPNIKDQNRGLDEVYGFKAVVSFRSRVVPFDRQGRNLYVEALGSMSNHCRRIMVLLHQQVDFIEKTDGYATALDIDKLTEFPRWFGTDPEPRSVTGEWFHSDNPNPEIDAGFVMEVRFGDARRMQTYANLH